MAPAQPARRSALLSRSPSPGRRGLPVCRRARVGGARALSEIGGWAVAAGDHDRQLSVRAVAGERRHGGLLAGDPALVVTRNDDLALVLGREDAPLRHPLIGRRRRQPGSPWDRRERPLAGLVDRIGPAPGDRDRGLRRGNRRDLALRGIHRGDGQKRCDEEESESAHDNAQRSAGPRGPQHGLVGHGLGAASVAAVQTAGLVEAAATVMT